MVAKVSSFLCVQWCLQLRLNVFLCVVVADVTAVVAVVSDSRRHNRSGACRGTRALSLSWTRSWLLGGANYVDQGYDLVLEMVLKFVLELQVDETCRCARARRCGRIIQPYDL